MPPSGGALSVPGFQPWAAYEVAPLVFGEIGVDLTVTGADPTGTNINDGCGSTHVEELDATGHDVAFAFDVQSGGHVRGHLAKRILRRANVDRLRVAVQHQHNRLVQ